MITTAADGAEIAYDDIGGGRYTFVFVHGWACDRTFWSAQAEDLSRDYRCISIDMRGRGESAAHPPYDLETQADDIAAVVRTLDAGPVILVGHSLGGIACLAVNERHPGLVLGIVTGDSPLRADLAGNDRLSSAVEAQGMAGASRMIEAFFTEGTPAALRERITATMLATPQDVAIGSLASSTGLGERMEQLVQLADQKPFMAIWSEKPLGDIRWLRDVCVFLRHEPMAGAGHFFQLEQPAITDALLRAFVDDVDRDPRIDALRP